MNNGHIEPQKEDNDLTCVACLRTGKDRNNWVLCTFCGQPVHKICSAYHLSHDHHFTSDNK